jgi:hypothetical protein
METIRLNGIEFRWLDQKYALSRCGKVLRKYVPYEPVIRRDGYLTISNYLVHRAVAQCWLDAFAPDKHVHHINGDKADNRVDNLECLTPHEHHSGRHFDIHSALGNHIRTQETRDKIRQARLGSVTSEATKEKQRAALIGKTRPYFIRAAHSEESRLARSENHVRSQSCSVNGVEYASFAIASKATGVHRFTIRKRCLSKNFPEYQILTPKS